MLFAAVAVCANLTLGLPPGFVDEPVLTGWNEAAGLAFSPVGDHLVVWEKAGSCETASGKPRPFSISTTK